MSSPERKIEKQVVKYCKLHGLYQRKFVSPGHVGVADRIIVGKQGTVFLELKAPGKKLRALQRRERDLIIKAGGRSFWADSWHGAKAVLDAVRADDPVKLLGMDAVEDSLRLVPVDTGRLRQSLLPATKLRRRVGCSLL